MGRALLELHSFLMCASVSEHSVVKTHLRLKQQCKAPLRSYPGSEKSPPILRRQILPLHVPLIRNGRVGSGEMMSLLLEVFNTPSDLPPLPLFP